MLAHVLRNGKANIRSFHQVRPWCVLDTVVLITSRIPVDQAGPVFLSLSSRWSAWVLRAAREGCVMTWPSPLGSEPSVSACSVSSGQTHACLGELLHPDANELALVRLAVVLPCLSDGTRRGQPGCSPARLRSRSRVQ